MIWSVLLDFCYNYQLLVILHSFTLLHEPADQIRGTCKKAASGGYVERRKSEHHHRNRSPSQFPSTQTLIYTRFGLATFGIVTRHDVTINQHFIQLYGCQTNKTIVFNMTALYTSKVYNENAYLMLFRYKASWFVQFYVVLWRCALNNMREPAIFRTRLFQVTVGTWRVREKERVGRKRERESCDLVWAMKFLTWS